MKRKLSLILALILTLLSVSFGKIKAVQPKYVLEVAGEETKNFNDADDLITYMKALNIDDNVPCILTLNADLEVPDKYDSIYNINVLESLALKGNMTLNGNNNTIKAKNMGCFGHLIKVACKKASIINLKLEGYNNCSGIELGTIYSPLPGDSPHGAELIVDGCEFNNCTYYENPSAQFSGVGGAISAYKAKFLHVKNSTFNSCEANAYGGAIFIEYSNFAIENTKFIKCKVNKLGGGAVYVDNSKGSITDSNFIENEVKKDTYGIYGGGAINVIGGSLDIKGTEFLKNKACSGGAISISSGTVNLNGSIFKENEANGLPSGTNDQPLFPELGDADPGIKIENCGGGAIYVEERFIDKLSINNSEFIENKSSTFGGAIRASYELAQSEETLKKMEASIDITNSSFIGNTAHTGYYNPMKNSIKYMQANKRNNSMRGKLIYKENAGTWVKEDSLFNNFDIAHTNNTITMTYDSNGASGGLLVEETTSSNYYYSDHPEYYPMPSKQDITVKTIKEVGFKNSTKFLGWNTKANGKGTWYQEGQEINGHYGNFYLFAIWEKPQEYTSLNLDENYSGGRVTHNDVMQGDLIEPYLYKPKRRGFTFKGWSYNKKHLDKVHYDDRIYEPTTVYAIWDEVEAEPEEIKGMTHKAYIFGYPDGTVRPNGEITRAEAAAMLARLLEIESIGSADKPSFPDTPSAWYNKAINAVVQRGIMKGYPDGTFKPNDAITRAEFTQMISTIDNKPYGVAPFADVIGHWAERPIGSEYQAGRILGYPDGTFRPDAHITRCEAAVILNKIFERNFDAMSLLKCKNPQMIKYFIDLDASFWGYNDMVEATNTHEFVRRTQNRVPEDWLLIK